VNRRVPFDLGVAPYPRAQRRVVTLGGANLFLFKGATEEEQQAAWKFVRFLLTSEAQQCWIDSSGYIVTTWSAYRSDYIQEILRKDPRRNVGYEQLPYCVPRPRYGAYNEISDNFIQIFTAAVQSNITPEDALAECDRLARKIIREHY
jgi:ABC-type glycerol-3-phosphate transport system substrate-binding protein